MRVLAIILCLNSLSYGQLKCCFQNLTPFSALSIQANTLTDTRIDVRWDDVQADSYVVTRNGTPVSGSPFSASITSISETGLIVNTQYIYKVTAYKNGYLASFNSDTTNTLSFSPSFMSLFHLGVVSNYNSINGGAQRSYTNQAGSTTGNSTWHKITSLVGNNGISYDASTTISNQPNMKSFDSENMFKNDGKVILDHPSNNYTPPYNLNSAITLSGDFTILWSERAPIDPVGTTQSLFGDGTNVIAYDFQKARFFIGGTFYNVNWPGGNHNTGSNVLTLGIKRVGAFIYAYDGTVWSSGASCPTTSFTISQQTMIVDHHGYYHGFCIVPVALSATQALEFFNILSRGNYVSASDDSNPTVSGAVFSTTLTSGGTGNYLSYPWMAYGPFGGGFKTVNQVGQGRYTFFAAQALDNATYKLANRIFIRDHTTNKLSDPIDMGIYTYNYDSVSTDWDQFGHQTPSLLCYDNRLHILQYFPHYDRLYFPQLEIRRTAPNFNFVSQKLWTPWKGQTNNIGRCLAYPRINRYSDKIVKVSADWNELSTFHQPSMEISTDNMNSWDFEQIFDNYGSFADVAFYAWGYPYLINNGGVNNKIIIITNFLIGSYVGWSICWADASAPHIIKNWDGSFSKDISNRNPITWAELKAHYIFTLATNGYQSLITGDLYNVGTTYALNAIVRTGTGGGLKFWRSKQNSNLGNTPAENAFWTATTAYHNQVSSCYMDATGEIFGVASDYVAGDGYNLMFYGTPGGTMTFKPSFNFNIFANGTYRMQLVKEGSGYSMYGINKATINQLDQWTTTDKGSTWTALGDITDGVHKHDNPTVSENHAFTGNVNLTAAYSSGGTLGVTPWQLWIK